MLSFNAASFGVDAPSITVFSAGSATLADADRL